MNTKKPSENFNPYHKWLGISPKDQPPHHYRLLGIDLFEEDLDVIEAAADRNMAFIQQCALGEYLKDSQRILNELSAARVCLLNPQQKVEYDKKLQAQLNPPDQESSLPTSAKKQSRKIKFTLPDLDPRLLRISGSAAGIVCLLILSVMFVLQFLSESDEDIRPATPPVAGFVGNDNGIENADLGKELTDDQKNI